MPTFYNTGIPTPSTKNTINSITVSYGIRDFLLNKNLAPVYPFLSTSLNGSPRIGEPVLDTQIGTGSITQPFGLPLETEGILRMEIAILPNRFKNTSPTAQNLVIVDDIAQTVGPFPNSTWQNGVTSYPTGSNPDVFNNGLMGKTVDAGYRKNATIKNLYLDVDMQVDAADWITLETSPNNTQIKGYLDVYGGLNLGGSAGIQAANIIGSVLNGQGLGIAKSGVVPNFDLRASLAGRVLAAAGAITDTKLGMIGGQQLALALANNAAFNVEQSVLGALNVQDNILSLVKNGTLAGFRPNYQITVPSGNVGRVLDYTARILGFTLPKSYLDDAGSIFLSESDSPNIERANSMILNTGKGQVQALLANIVANINGTGVHDNPDFSHFRSGYVPGFKDNKGAKAINPSVYAFGDADGMVYNFITTGQNTIPEISYNRSKMIENYGFTGTEDSGLIGDSYNQSNIINPTFSWGSNTGGLTNSLNTYQSTTHDKKTLLGKTQMLFNSVGMKTIVSAKGLMNVTPSQLQTAVVGYGISKGNAVMSSANFDLDSGRYIGVSAKTADETYCRSWTTFSRYEKVSNLGRNTGLNGTVPYRHQYNNSVLDEYGFAKIAPYSTDNPDDPKKYMFSIENLAWADDVNNLLPCEVGPGDLISGKQGRIMWFPPYDIKFSESNSVSWETNNFVGRGESVYTYNNTERGGQLSFSIIVDHPSYINSFRGSNGPDDHYVASFFAGCIDPSSKFAEKLTVSEISTIESQNVTVPQKAVDTPQVPPIDKFDIYFPNDVYVFVKDYEDGKCNGVPIDYSVNNAGTGCTSVLNGQVTSSSPWTNRYNFGLNSGSGEGTILNIVGDTTPYSGFSDTNFLPALDAYLKSKCPNCIATVTGYASKQGTDLANATLSLKRATDLISNNLLNSLFTFLTPTERAKRFKAVSGGAIDSPGCIPGDKLNTDNHACKVARKATIKFTYDINTTPKTTTPAAQPITPPPQQVQVNTKIINRFYTECNYFEQLTTEDYFIFDKFREKIKYFHPAFHSTTPEGLNSRLTFLNQCTRQGRTLEAQGANNLAFGRPPVCILRVGDFYNTKIIIENISIDYEPLVWDLNPEGVGVQPMIAKVNMSFKFIGGSTLEGPINKLQNALSFNYYANAHVYDPRADYISKDRPTIKTKDTKGNVTLTQPPVSDTGYYINNLIENSYFGDENQAIEKIKSSTGVEDNTGVQNQVAANDNEAGPTAPQTSQTPTGTPSDDASKLKISQAKYDNGFLSFFIVRKDASDNSALSQNYDLLVSVQSDTVPTAYSFDCPIKVSGVDLSTPQISLSTSTPQAPTVLPSSYKKLVVQLKGTTNKLIANLS